MRTFLLVISAIGLLASCGGGGGDDSEGGDPGPGPGPGPGPVVPTLTFTPSTLHAFGTLTVSATATGDTTTLVARIRHDSDTLSIPLTWNGSSFDGSVAVPGIGDPASGAQIWIVEAQVVDGDFVEFGSLTVNAPELPPALPNL